MHIPDSYRQLPTVTDGYRQLPTVKNLVQNAVREVVPNSAGKKHHVLHQVFSLSVTVGNRR